MAISKSTIDFLKAIRENNNKPWFEANKDTYLTAKDEFKIFAEDLRSLMDKHDLLEKHKIFRIYRDVRFSKDKTPYKSNMSIGFTRATKALRGGYYLHVEPGNIFAGGGFWAPETKDLKRIRDEFATSDKEIREIINNQDFIKHFGTLQGEGIKTAPRGFDKNHPAIDLIRKKQFVVMKPFSEQEVMSENFAREVDITFQAMRPFFDYMSDVLTTNINGESIL
jgi:uncharacterized protein (TIGR02453 family)